MCPPSPTDAMPGMVAPWLSRRPATHKRTLGSCASPLAVTCLCFSKWHLLHNLCSDGSSRHLMSQRNANAELTTMAAGEKQPARGTAALPTWQEGMIHSAPPSCSAAAAWHVAAAAVGGPRRRLESCLVHISTTPAAGLPPGRVRPLKQTMNQWQSTLRMASNDANGYSRVLYHWNV
jgi:hypothetical protein